MYRPGDGADSEHSTEYTGASRAIVLLLLHDFPDPGRSHRFPGSSPCYRAELGRGPALIGSDEDGQGSTSREEDLTSVIIRKQRQVTTACFASTRLWRRSGIIRSLKSGRPGVVMLDTSRPSTGSVAA